MANGINKIILLGNLGSQPELRHLPNGNAVLNISLYTDESYYDNTTNQKVETGEWHNLALFGPKAENIAKYANKGDQIYIEGSNKTREWEKDGVKRWSTEIKVSDFRFLRNGTRDQQAPAAGQNAQQGQQSAPQSSAQPAYAAPAQAQPPIGFFNADGSVMSVNEANRYKGVGYVDGWFQGQIPPVLPNQ